MSEPPTRRRLPTSAAVIAGVLLLVPCLALAVVPIYSRETPRLWGWPFFYWYQVLWVFLTPLLTYAAFKVIQHARGEQ